MRKGKRCHCKHKKRGKGMGSMFRKGKRHAKGYLSGLARKYGPGVKRAVTKAAKKEGKALVQKLISAQKK